MNKSNTTLFSFFIAINLLINIFAYSINVERDNYSILLWFGNFIILYFIYYFIPKYSKISWLIFGSYIVFNYYSLNNSTFKLFYGFKYSYNHLIVGLNYNVKEYIYKLTDIIPNLNFFSVNVNFLSIIILTLTIIYIFIYENKFVNQIISENVFLYMLIIIFISILFPIKNNELYTENIGIGDLSKLNDTVLYFINYPFFASASMQIGLFLIISLFMFKKNPNIGMIYFIIFLILIIGHITLMYSNFVEISISCLSAIFVYFNKMKPKIDLYSNSIRF